MMKAKRKNNKGFTLVEMIIVIAVMSILAIVVSPQLIKYIEKANRGTDRQAVWEMAHAAQIAYVASEDITDTTVLVSIDKDGNFSYEIEDLDNEVKTVIPETSYKYKSKLYRGGDEIPTNILITIDVNGNIDITTGEDAYTALQEQYEAARLKAEQSATVRGNLGTAYGNLSDRVTQLTNALNNLDYDDTVKAAQQAYDIADAAVGTAQTAYDTAKAVYDKAIEEYNNLPRYLHSDYALKLIEKTSGAAFKLADETLTDAKTTLETEKANVETRINEWKTNTTNSLNQAKQEADDKKAEWDAKKAEAEADKAEADRLGGLLNEKIAGSQGLYDHIHEVTGTAKEE